ncbi:MAG TPA: hypothetical protein VD815_02205 [Candidatus Saccharimonadales bacterium]|nr:hypothetical protein [Candidatus Saccharimonadales bacterium]
MNNSTFENELESNEACLNGHATTTKSVGSKQACIISLKEEGGINVFT